MRAPWFYLFTISFFALVPEPEHHKIDKISPEERSGISLDKFFDEV